MRTQGYTIEQRAEAIFAVLGHHPDGQAFALCTTGARAEAEAIAAAMTAHSLPLSYGAEEPLNDEQFEPRALPLAA